MTSLVFDLRGNGGGLLRDAVDIVNLFVGNDQKIVTQRGKIKEMNMEYTASKPAVDTELPIVVLIDRRSASASEIVSGSLQELDRAVLVGQRSFGKGLVQQTYNLSYNTMVKVTIAKYYTPSGRCIQALDYAHRSNEGNVSKVADSLINEFKTKGGRSVYDGSGVYPDIYLDPVYMSPIAVSLVDKFQVFDFANEYYRSHQSIPTAKEFGLSDTDYESFVSFLQGKKYDYVDRSEKQLEELKEALEMDKHFEKLKGQYETMKAEMLANKRNDLVNHRQEIRDMLEEEIVSRYYYEKGRTELALKNDPELKRAIEVLQDKPLYSSILKGEGAYKVIGKPGSEAHQKAIKEREESED
jgi:carboxyl-terminal processing protease